MEKKSHANLVYNVFLVFLVVLNILPFLAPILLKLGESASFFILPAKFIYFVYSFACHQFEGRSLHIFDYQMAWCVRDTGIWLGVLGGALLIKKFPQFRTRWYWVIPFVIPIALDGGIQTVATILNISPVGLSGSALYISSNVVRFLTGSFFGLGISLWLSGIVWESAVEVEGSAAKKEPMELTKARLKWLVIVMVSLLVGYVGLVRVWDWTAVNYHPIDFLDSAPKVPLEGFYDRRGHAICPGNINDEISFDCFWH